MKISQREARRLRKRVEQLEAEQIRLRSRWASDWGPGWVNIESLTLTPESFAKVRTARLLDHAVVILPSARTNEVLLYADRLT
jgi:hypothetical protein